MLPSSLPEEVPRNQERWSVGAQKANTGDHHHGVTGDGVTSDLVTLLPIFKPVCINVQSSYCRSPAFDGLSGAIEYFRTPGLQLEWKNKFIGSFQYASFLVDRFLMLLILRPGKVIEIQKLRRKRGVRLLEICVNPLKIEYQKCPHS